MKKTITLLILGALLPVIFSIFQPDIKRVLGIDPKIVWQNEFYRVNDNLLVPITIFNSSNVSGDLTLTLIGRYSEKDFIIKNNTSKINIETDSANTFVKIDPFYAKEEIEIILATSTFIYPDPKLSSRTYAIEEKYPFPTTEKNSPSKFKKILMLFFSWAMIFFFAYHLGKINCSQNKIN